MNKEEIDKWLNEEYGCSYTRLEELHDFYFEKYCDLRDRISKAIEYLNKKWIEGSDIYEYFSAGCGCGNNFDFEEDRNGLLEILGGKE